MKTFLVTFMKKGELFEVVVSANNSYDAREFVSIKNNIPMNFEIGKHENENNYVSAVIEI